MEVTTTTMLKVTSSSQHPFVGEKVPLTVFDRAAFDVFVPLVFAYPAPAPPSNEALKDGLLKAVATYPHLAGRLAVDGDGRPFLHVNNEGVLVIESTVPANLADVLANNGGAHLYPEPPEDNVGAALLQIKLTRYRCGGLVVGVISYHRACDGNSTSTFLNTWARAVRDGKDDFTSPSPFLDRAATAVARSPPAPAFNHRSIEFKAGARGSDSSKSHAVVPMDRIRNLTVHFTDEFVAELKGRVGTRCSTFQCLLAHVWKKMTAARELKPEEFTWVRVAVDCRGRANPPVPVDFFGNMVLWAFPRLQVRELLNSCYRRVVGAICDAVERIDDVYIQSFVDFGEVVDVNGEEELVSTAAVAGTMLCPGLEVDSLLGFRFHEMDLGTGPPSAFLPPDLPVEGLMLFVPAKGGVDLFIAVAEGHLPAFQQICFSLEENRIEHSCL